MKLEIITGDITKFKCDAIVCPVNQRLGNSKGISSVIHQTIGKTYLKPTSVDISVGRCFVTAANKLPFRKVIYTVFPYINPFYDPYELFLSRLPGCYQNAVQRALTEGCTSVAFPLLGAWDEIYPLEKVMDIALDSLVTIMQNNPSELSIYLVLTDKQSALKQYADKRIFPPVANDKQSDEVLSLDKRWISLCKVNKLDRNRDIWLLRLADAIDGSLVAPSIDDSKEQTFDNRRLIFREDGPNTPDSIGFWEWKERKSDSGRWWSDATYMEETAPIEIMLLNNQSSVEQIADQLKSGLHIPAHVTGKILFAVKQNYSFVGLLCDLSNFDIRRSEDQFIVLKDNIYMLPYYELREADIFTWNDRKVYKHISLGEPKKRFPIHIPVQLLKQLFLQRMSWPVFKAQGIVKGDWQKIKQFFIKIPDNTILETVSQTYGMSVQEALSCVDAFLQTIESHINVEDIDSSLIIQMLDNHGGLKQRFDGIAQKKWQEEHQTEVEQAQAEIADMRNAVQQDVMAAKQRLSEVEKNIADAVGKHKGILSEIAASENKLNQLIADIEQYETLGNDALEAVRTKITEAQKDMAGFIADLSVVMPQPKAVTVEQPKADWRFVHSSTEKYALMEPEVCDSWRDEYDLLHDNLDSLFAVNSELLDMFAAYLYAAKEAKMPLLVVGPYGTEVSHALSMAIHAREAGCLELGRTWDRSVVETIKEADDPVISIANLIAGGWADALSQKFASINKQIICTHPYHEDLLLEPKGMYNYVLPVLAECFIEGPPVGNLLIGKRSKKYKGFEASDKHTLRLAAWKRLKLSKLMLNQIERVLTYTKCIINRETSNKDIEVLFGILPLAVLTGKTEILKDLLEEEKSLSRAVKAEIERYIEEE